MQAIDSMTMHFTATMTTAPPAFDNTTDDVATDHVTTEKSEWVEVTSLGPAWLVTRWMWALWAPVVLVAGTFGNVASLLTLLRLRSGAAINVYLLALALSDLLMLHTSLLRYWLLEMFDFDIFGHPVLCKLGMWLLGTTWNNSTYLLVALTVHRALSVVWPHRVHVICTPATCKVIIGGIAVASLLLLAHVPYGYDVVYGAGDNAFGRCGHGSYAYTLFNSKIWAFVEIVTFALLPFLCLLVSNAVLAWTLRGSVSAATLSLSNGPSHAVAERRKKASSTSVTVMAMSLVFVVFNLPLFVHLIVNSAHNVDATAQQDAATGLQLSGVEYFLQSFFIILLCCNFSVNFYLYCLTGARFRWEFLKLVGTVCRACSGSSLSQPASKPDTARAAADTQDEF